MKKEGLPNGLTVLFEPKNGNSVVVEVMVNVGSNDEMPSERGITHFIEHMVFEGTKKRPTNRDISNEIEKIGGEFNAYTTNERTCFYVKVLKKHFRIAVEVLGDILQHSQFNEEHLQREKKVVLKEIDMVHDDPRLYQWILFQTHLFLKNPAKYPTYGDKKVIRGLTREKVVEYFKKYYIPSNITIAVVGDINNWRQELQKTFVFPASINIKKVLPHEPQATKNTLKLVRKKVANTYVVLGFKTVPRSHPEAYVLEVINGILGRGQSGRMFTEIRTKYGLAYDVGTQNISEISYGYFGVYATIDKKNVQKVRKLILKELKSLQKVTPLDVKEAKDFVEGAYCLELEEAQKVSGQMVVWEQAGDARKMETFVQNIKKVTPADVKRVAKKYFKHHLMVVLEGK